MSECSEGTWRDRLPDLVTGRLSDSDAVEVDAHVAGCRSCADELQLLRIVHAARPQVAPPAVAAIVARLPKPAIVGAEVPRPTASPEVVPISQAFSRRRPGGERWVWRLAASAVLMVGAAGAFLLTGPGTDPSTADEPVVAVESIAGTPADPTVGVSLSYGGAWDLSEAEMQEVLASLERWDGAPSTDIETTPLVLASGGDRE